MEKSSESAEQDHHVKNGLLGRFVRSRYFLGGRRSGLGGSRWSARRRRRGGGVPSIAASDADAGVSDGEALASVSASVGTAVLSGGSWTTVLPDVARSHS